jgi:cytochrome c556
MNMKVGMIGRVACVVAVSLTVALSNGQAGSPASYMYILMINMIGPAGNSLSQTAAIQTLSDQDWNRVKQMAARLNQSAEAVSSGGTTPADIERAKSREWKAWAGKFSDAVSLAINAAERRDKAALVAAADELAEVCKGCHSAFPEAAR